MLRFVFLVMTAVLLTSSPKVMAQNAAYVQIEAQPSFSVAHDRLRDYAAALPDVNGFELDRGWYGIALGPYPREEAQRVLRRLLVKRLIPSDSYIKDAASYGERVWSDTVNPATVPAITEHEASVSPDIQPVTRVTDRETLGSERTLTEADMEVRQNANPAMMPAGFYVQIEAQPNLSVAQDRLLDYAAALPDVNGFELDGGWYGIALGPYPREEAARVLRRLRVQNLIPSDSYIKASDRYGQHIWVAGQDPNKILPIAEPDADVKPVPDRQAAKTTLREAQRSELKLTRQERLALQLALQWAGFYDSALNGIFGASTRFAMSVWQQSNGFETTGVLTTAQRAKLLHQYNAVLDGMDITPVRDARLGISIDLPLGAMAFARYESPFAHFDPTGTVEGARILLISQPGDHVRLAGLYEIMQTLDIVPMDGLRKRGRDSFTLIGRDSHIVSHTEARLDGDAIKGFTLVWPAGDEERRARILSAMQSSFTPIEGVLEPKALTEDQGIDLVAGISLAKPKITTSGFFVDHQGLVVTTDTAVANCGRITLNRHDEAHVVMSDPSLGIAVLRTSVVVDPDAVAQFRKETPRLRAEIAVAGYSFGGVLPSAAMTFGHLSSLRGLNDEPTLLRLAINTLQGDAGGPVLDDGGAVIGMLVPHDVGGRKLPDNVNFALNGRAIQQVLSSLGMMPQRSDTLDEIHPVDLTQKAAAMTVLVSCWE